jgi:Fe-S cluster assembly ATP-binding protein
MIVISHQERVMKLADEIILMQNGKIEKFGARDEMLGKLNTD